MDRWVAGQLDSAGSIRLQPGEQKHNSQSSVRLYDGDERTAYDDGTLTVTNYRLVWVETGVSTLTMVLDLALITGVKNIPGNAGFSYIPGLKFSSPKLLVHLQPTNKNHKTHFVKLSFRHTNAPTGLPVFETALNYALDAKEWEKKEMNQQEPTLDNKIGVGLSGIRRDREREIQRGKQTIEGAFDGDLKDLMGKTKQLVALSRHYSDKVSRGEVSASDSREFSQYLQSLGIESPVVRCEKGEGAFHEKLSHELATFIKEPLSRNNDMMLLQDLFCLYNRARGTNLVSPNDMVEACRNLKRLGHPYELHTFASGVKVIQATSQSEEVVANNVLAFVTSSAFSSVSQYAEDKGISLALAREQMLVGERLGLICRDETVEGLRFFPNRFCSG
eukprot:m.338976 g.338976  ORF g.338976 m.338976 type:complete len:390 (+) comp18616_c0_seq1:247-1416(+)